MDLLDRLLGHDAATTRQLLLLSQGLSDEQLDRRFDIGHETLRATFRHLIGNMEVWTDLLRERPAGRPQAAADTVEGLLTRLDAVTPGFAAIAAEIRDEGRWDDTFIDTLDRPPQAKSFGGTIGHVLTHSMHHRGEILHILARLGVQDLPEGDLLGWEMAQRRAASQAR